MAEVQGWVLKWEWLNRALGDSTVLPGRAAVVAMGLPRGSVQRSEQPRMAGYLEKNHSLKTARVPGKDLKTVDEGVSFHLTLSISVYNKNTAEKRSLH